MGVHIKDSIVYTKVKERRIGEDWDEQISQIMSNWAEMKESREFRMKSHLSVVCSSVNSLIQEKIGRESDKVTNW